jgi:hypothetical protein
VSVLADDVAADAHGGEAALRGPGKGGLDQGLAVAMAAARRGDHQASDLAARLRLELAHLADVQPADHRALVLGGEDGVLGAAEQVRQARGGLRRVRRIPQLGRQLGDRPGIGEAAAADGHRAHRDSTAPREPREWTRDPGGLTIWRADSPPGAQPRLEALFAGRQHLA